MNIDLPGGRQLDVSEPVVMGVLNVTPDSFSDGGRHVDVSRAIDVALRMIDEGATIIDVGGESTRPGATPVSAEEECRRVLPVIEALRLRSNCIISIDTMKPDVMREACRAGASIINDVNALRSDQALTAAMESGAAVCLMHMQGEPQTMQHSPSYSAVVDEVIGFLRERIAACVTCGIPESRLLIDPGFGFGKRLVDNLDLLACLPALATLGRPILVGMSRKGMLGQLTGRAVDDRLAAGTAVAAIAALHGAKIVRTHDVAATLDAIKVGYAIRAASQAIVRPA
ncbi:MAG: dihydropteroate synthase [Xanthomonadaceae bacterium]|nr:dihydropteroate synthase [Xanthomonadaceae bacterium]